MNANGGYLPVKAYSSARAHATIETVLLYLRPRQAACAQINNRLPSPPQTFSPSHYYWNPYEKMVVFLQCLQDSGNLTQVQSEESVD